MFPLLGFLVIFVMVFGGYKLAGGHFAILIKALPFELMIIGGAASGIFLIANPREVIVGTVRDLAQVFSGPRWQRGDYRDLLSLLFTVVRHIKMRGFLALEPHIDEPNSSTLFTRYPRILNDHFATTLITDTIRMMIMSLDDPYQVEDWLQKQLDRHEKELAGRVAALQLVADSLPALGIVAAVLGVIKTMASISEPVEVLGAMIGGALVGTFLGVFLAYCFVGPLAAKLQQAYEHDAGFYQVIRDCLVACLHGHAAPIAVELARGNIGSEIQPSFHEMELVLESLPLDPLAAAPEPVPA
jgi:chemotaxis protein MotA